MLPNPMLPSAESRASDQRRYKHWWERASTPDDEHGKMDREKVCHSLNGVAIHYCHEAEIDDFDRKLGLPPDKMVACPHDRMGYFAIYYRMGYS